MPCESGRAEHGRQMRRAVLETGARKANERADRRDPISNSDSFQSFLFESIINHMVPRLRGSLGRATPGCDIFAEMRIFQRAKSGKEGFSHRHAYRTE